MNILKRHDVMMREWTHWKIILKQLSEMGAITEADKTATPNATDETPGTRLLRLLREWGELMREIEQVNMTRSQRWYDAGHQTGKEG